MAARTETGNLAAGHERAIRQGLLAFFPRRPDNGPVTIALNLFGIG
jgi:hypothetical protein